MQKKARAAEGVGKREALRAVGSRLTAEIEAEKKRSAAPGTLSDFYANVYVHHHGVSDRTWRSREKWRRANPAGHRQSSAIATNAKAPLT